LGIEAGGAEAGGEAGLETVAEAAVETGGEAAQIVDEAAAVGVAISVKLS